MMQPNITEQKAYYDTRWETEVAINSLQIERCAAILTELSRLELKSPRILDLGCGTGWLTSILSHFGGAVGVDLSVASATRRYPHLTFYEADLTSWHPSIERFDVIVSQEVIEHIEEQKDFINVATDLLNPGGHLILTTPNARTTAACSQEWRKAWLRQPVENVISARSLRSLLAPKFAVLRLTSITTGVGETLLYRAINSPKLWAVLKNFGLLPIYDNAIKEMKLGLHLLAVARKR
jgi:trans-aconitate methyltransferase